MNFGMSGQFSPYGTVAYASADVRADFIRKVYSLFFASILVTVGVGAFCAQPAMLPVTAPLMQVSGIGAIVCIIALMFTRSMPGVNLGLYYLFAALEGAVLGPLLTFVNAAAPGLPFAAGLLTFAVFGGLSLYAIQSRKDFSYLGGMLFAGVIALFIAGILLVFLHIPALSLLYSVGGVLIFSGYVLYDTSRIMQRLGPDDAVMGAISLYLDLINLFLFILQLLMSLSGNSRRD